MRGPRLADNGAKLRWCDYCMGWFGKPQRVDGVPCCPGCLLPNGSPPTWRKRRKINKNVETERQRRKRQRKRERVYLRDGGCCVVCGSADDLTLDHIVPKSKGGTDRYANLQTMCRPCNERKADAMPEKLTPGSGI